MIGIRSCDFIGTDDTKTADLLHSILEPFLLRRTKSEVITNTYKTYLGTNTHTHTHTHTSGSSRSSSKE